MFTSQYNHYAVVSVLQKPKFTPKMFIPIDPRFSYMKYFSTVWKQSRNIFIKSYMLNNILFIVCVTKK